MSASHFTDADIQNSDTVESQIIPNAQSAAYKTMMKQSSCGKFFAQIPSCLSKICSVRSALNPNAVNSHPETFKRPYHVLLEEKDEIESFNAQIRAQSLLETAPATPTAKTGAFTTFLRSASRFIPQLGKKASQPRPGDAQVASSALSDISEEPPQEQTNSEQNQRAPSRQSSRHAPRLEEDDALTYRSDHSSVFPKQGATVPNPIPLEDITELRMFAELTLQNELSEILRHCNLGRELTRSITNDYPETMFAGSLLLMKLRQQDAPRAGNRHLVVAGRLTEIISDLGNTTNITSWIVMIRNQQDALLHTVTRQFDTEGQSFIAGVHAGLNVSTAVTLLQILKTQPDLQLSILLWVNGSSRAQTIAMNDLQALLTYLQVQAQHLPDRTQPAPLIHNLSAIQQPFKAESTRPALTCQFCATVFAAARPDNKECGKMSADHDNRTCPHWRRALAYVGKHLEKQTNKRTTTAVGKQFGQPSTQADHVLILDPELATTYACGGYHESFYSPLLPSDNLPIFVEQSPETPRLRTLDPNDEQCPDISPSPTSYNLSATLNNVRSATLDITHLLVCDSGCTSLAMFNNIKFFPEGFTNNQETWAQGAHDGQNSALKITGQGRGFFIATDSSGTKHLIIIENAAYVEEHLTTSMIGTRGLRNSGGHILADFKGFTLGPYTFVFESHPTGLWNLPYNTIDRSARPSLNTICIHSNKLVCHPIALINKPKVLSNAQSEQYLELHSRYGHISDEDLRRLKLLPPSVHVHRNCPVCSLSKAIRVGPQEHFSTIPSTPWAEAAVDTMGPLPVAGMNGERYITSFTDRCTRMILSFGHEFKSAQPEILKDVVYGIKAMSNGKYTIGCLRTDNGGEFTSKQYVKMLKQHNIQHEKIAAYHHEQLGSAERTNLTLQRGMRCAILESRAPAFLAVQAAQLAAINYNRRILPDGRSIYAHTTGCETSDKYIYPFGCLAIVCEGDNPPGNMLLSPGTSMIYCGIDSNPRQAIDNMKFFNPHTGRMVTSTRAKMHPRIFPFTYTFKDNMEKLYFPDIETQRAIIGYSLVGETVRKKFDKGWFNGNVCAFNTDDAQYTYTWSVVFTDKYTFTYDIATLKQMICSTYAHNRLQVSDFPHVPQTLICFAEQPLDDTNHFEQFFDKYIEIALLTHEISSLHQLQTISELVGKTYTYNEVARHPILCTKLQAAIDKEILNWTTHEVLVPVLRSSLPPDTHIYRTNWTFTAKHDIAASDTIILKGRAYIIGNSKMGELEVYAPVVSADAARFFLAFCNHFDMEIDQHDVSAAYLHTLINRKVYFFPPNGMAMPPGCICQALKAIYGLEESGRLWHEDITKKFHDYGFVDPLGDKTFFVYYDPDDTRLVQPSGPCPRECAMLMARVPTLVVILYVDDVGQGHHKVNNECANKFNVYLDQYYTVKRGPMTRFTGWSLLRDRSKGLLYMNHSEQIKTFCKEMNVTYSRKTPPLTPMMKSLRKPSPELLLGPAMITMYRKLVGKFRYWATNLRPDIQAACNELSRFLSCVGPEQMAAATHLLHYLDGTSERQLVFGRPHPLDMKVHSGLYAFSDAEHNTADHGAKPTLGIIVRTFNATIISRSKTSTTVSTSSMDAEMNGLFVTTRDVMYVRKLMTAVGLSQDRPTLVHEDNTAVLAIIRDPAHREKTKHCDNRLLFLREAVSNLVIEPTYCPTNRNYADLNTKQLPPQTYQAFSTFVMGGIMG